MRSLTNEITIYFSALAREPQINLNNLNNKKTVCWHLIFREGLKIASNLWLYLKTSLALSTPLTNILLSYDNKNYANVV